MGENILCDVSIVGAGPGSYDLLTLRAIERLKRADIILYAGSLVPEEVFECAKNAKQKINTSSLNLEEQCQIYLSEIEKGNYIVRLHSGDPAIYGAIGEQIEFFKENDISFEIVPGVSSFLSSSASLGVELTIPEISQSVILTRISKRASKMPEKESLENLAKIGATMAVFLCGADLENTINTLKKEYPKDTKVALVQNNEKPNERRIVGTLDNILDKIKLSEWRLTTLLLVGEVLKGSGTKRSNLYFPKFSHKYRKGEKS